MVSNVKQFYFFFAWTKIQIWMEWFGLNSEQHLWSMCQHVAWTVRSNEQSRQNVCRIKMSAHTNDYYLAILCAIHVQLYRFRKSILAPRQIWGNQIMDLCYCSITNYYNISKTFASAAHLYCTVAAATPAAVNSQFCPFKATLRNYIYILCGNGDGSVCFLFALCLPDDYVIFLYFRSG